MSDPIETAKRRLTTARLGHTWARETDKDLLALRDLIQYTEGTQIQTLLQLAQLPVGSVILDLGPGRSLEDAPVVACRARAGHWEVLGQQDASGALWSDLRVWEATQKNVLVCAHKPAS